MTHAPSALTRHPGASSFGWSGASRRFHLINVSLPKTGTKSVAGLFSRFRAFHEFQHEASAQAIVAYHTGRCSREDMRQFVLARDAAGLLEVDSASFNNWYADLCVDLFPRAIFLLSVRHPHSWLESVLSHMRRDAEAAQSQSVAYPERFRRLGELVVGDFDPDVLLSQKALVEALPHLTTNLLAFWTERQLALLACLPEDRRIVIETDRLTESSDKLARFVGVNPQLLDLTASHLHRRPTGDRTLDLIDAAQLQAATSDACMALWQRLALLSAHD